MKTIKWFAVAFGVAFGSTAGILATASPGDLIYKSGGHKVEITGPQAACFAQCAINIDNATENSLCGGINTGAMLKVIARRDTGSETGFSAVCHGTKSAAPGELPVVEGGVTVLGIVE